jgi:hypothetical protein
MNDDFVAEILRATGAMRSGDPSGATDIIQAALAAGGLTGLSRASRYGGPHGGLQPSSDAAAPRRALHRRRDRDRPAGFSERPNHYSKAFGSPRLRKPLSEVLETLTAGRKGLGLDGMAPGLAWPSRAPDLPMPEGPSSGPAYACAAGARRYRLYVPASPVKAFKA